MARGVVTWHGDAVMAKIHRGMVIRLKKAAILVEGATKTIMNKGGRTASGGQPSKGEKASKINSFRSKPGEPPRVQIGTLQRSITHEVDAVKLEARVGTNLNYAKPLELGTSKMAPRPFLRPALHMSQPAILVIFAERII